MMAMCNSFVCVCVLLLLCVLLLCVFVCPALNHLQSLRVDQVIALAIDLHFVHRGCQVLGRPINLFRGLLVILHLSRAHNRLPNLALSLILGRRPIRGRQCILLAVNTMNIYKINYFVESSKRESDYSARCANEI